MSNYFGVPTSTMKLMVMVVLKSVHSQGSKGKSKNINDKYYLRYDGKECTLREIGGKQIK